MVAWLWLLQALRAGAAPGLDDDFRRGTLQACRYFFAYELPKVAAWCDTVGRFEGIALHAKPAWF